MPVCGGDHDVYARESTISQKQAYGSLYRFKHGHVLVPVQSSLTITLPSAEISAVSTSSSVPSSLLGSSQSKRADAHAVASHQAFSERPVTISSIHDSITVLGSKERPRKLTLLGSDGASYIFLCKKEVKGDMRKNSRMMEFASVINRMLKKKPDSRLRQLRMRTFSVLPLTEECGVIEWINNTHNFRLLVKDMHERNGIALHHKEVRSLYQYVNDERKRRKDKEAAADAINPRTPAQMVQAREKRRATSAELILYHTLLDMCPPSFHQWFLHEFADPTCWFQSRLAYSHSTAVWSMVGFVVGLGDRHGENILVDGKNGECVHVDFDCFPEADTRVLTDHGFLFLSEVEERNWQYKLTCPGKEVLYGCYEVASMEVKYRKGELVYSAPPQHWVQFESEGEGKHWTDESGPNGSDGLIPRTSKGETRCGHVSLRVTPNHDMFVQLGNESSGASKGEVWWQRENGVERPPHRMKANKVLSCDAAHVRIWACAKNGYEPPSHNRRRAVQDALNLSAGQFAAFLELLGFWLGRGTQTYHRSGNSGHVRFCQAKTTDLAWLEKTLEEAGLDGSQWSSAVCNKERVLLIKQPAWCVFFHDELDRMCDVGSKDAVQPADDVIDLIADASEDEARPDEQVRDEEEDHQGVDDDGDTLPPETSKSVKWLPAWVLAELSGDEMQLLIAGLRRAAGSFKGKQNEISTSDVRFRDQLMQALLHCGYSPYPELVYKKGDTCAYIVNGKHISCKQAELLGKTTQPVLATVDAWNIAWTEGCQPHIQRRDGISRVRYHERDGRAWCVKVEHKDHLIIAQRAQRDSSGIVTKQSRPIIVGNCLFGKGLTLDTPERVPFRLTANIIDGFGLTGIEGVYRRSCEVTMAVMRENAQTLLSVLHTFLYDPLLEWKKDTSTAAAAGRDQSLISVLPPPIAGYGHDGGVGDRGGTYDVNTAAEKLSEVEQKLQGVVNVATRDTFPLSVNGQVDCLIKDACSENNLAQMYMGWMPWV